MRLKTFSAANMREAMDAVRAAMGPEAIIVSVEHSRKAGGVRVTAAVDRAPGPPREPRVPRTEPTPAMTEERRGARFVSRDFDPADIKAAINHHGLPFALAERLLAIAATGEAASAAEALARGFEALIGFSPLALDTPGPIMLVGPPGAGKTVAAAKLAAEAVVNGRAPRLLTTDTVKSGGAQQLEHYGKLMDRTVGIAGDADALAAAVAGTSGPTLIDSSGTNAFDMDEIERTVRLIRAAKAEPVLVLPAGLDPAEAADIAGIFARMGARRLIVTRLDGARRHGGLLAAARGGDLALAGMSRSPWIAEPLETPDALALARLFAAACTGRTRDRARERTS